MATGGEVMAPEGPHVPIQLIDVRDLSDWTIRSIETGLTCTYNATGPAEVLSFGTLINECIKALEVDAQVTWTSLFLLPGSFLPRFWGW